MNVQQDPFLQFLNLYTVAVRSKDIDAFVALYDEDLHVFDMWSKWSLRGIEPWRKMAAEWFASLGTEQVAVAFDEAQTTKIGALTIGHAILKYTALSAEGDELRSLNNRITVALRNAGGSWKVIHEHTSAPIDHGSMKAMLQRHDGEE